MRRKISETLRSATSTAALQQTVTNSSIHEALSTGSARRRTKKRGDGNLVARPSPELRMVSTTGQRISGVRPANRKRDTHTKQIIANLRQNSGHLDKLIGLACS